MLDCSGATVLDDLPEAIMVEEVLLRLPAKDVFRCRAVRRSWRLATSTHDFMVAHHRRQPSRPIIDHVLLGGENAVKASRDSRLVAFTCEAAFDHKLSPVIRYADPGTQRLTLHAALDGLLVVSSGSRLYYVCNPVTRQCAPLYPLTELSWGDIAGFYRHHPSGEYGVLYSMNNVRYEGDFASYFVFTVGSDDESRCIWRRSPPALPASLEYSLLYWLPCCSLQRNPPPVQHCGSLHWIVPRPDKELASNAMEIEDIISFDTTGETFRWMCRPAHPGPWPLLFEVDGVIALCGTRDGTSCTHIEVLMMQEYEAGVWDTVYQIPAYKLSPSIDSSYVCRMAVLKEHEMLIKFPGYRLLHCHIDGQSLSHMVVKCDEADDRVCGMEITLHSLQENIFQFPFFEVQEEDGVNKEHPFNLGM